MEELMPSTKPYLLRALWEWCCDNGFTPHLSVAVDEFTEVPREFVRQGQIVLNIGPSATHKLSIGNEWIEFQARFGGIPRQLSIPVRQVLAIYARENGAGMAFEPELEGAPPVSPLTPSSDDRRPHLAAVPNTPRAPESAETADTGGDEPPTRPTTPGRPKLQRIK